MFGLGYGWLDFSVYWKETFHGKGPGEQAEAGGSVLSSEGLSRGAAEKVSRVLLGRSFLVTMFQKMLKTTWQWS